jgi:hypothetical protein
VHAEVPADGGRIKAVGLDLEREVGSKTLIPAALWCSLAGSARMCSWIGRRPSCTMSRNDNHILDGEASPW